MARRTEAIDAVAAYSLFEEGDTCRLPQDKRSPKDGIAVEPAQEDGSIQDTKMIETDYLADDRLVVAVRSVMKDRRFVMKNKGLMIKDERPLFCFICLGRPDLDIRRRTYKFARNWSAAMID